MRGHILFTVFFQGFSSKYVMHSADCSVHTVDIPITDMCVEMWTQFYCFLIVTVYVQCSVVNRSVCYRVLKACCLAVSL